MALLRPEHHWPSSSTVACSTTRIVRANGGHFLSTNCNWCFVYELLRRLFHIGNFCFWVPFLKQLLLRNCAADFVEICNVYVGKMIIKAANWIFNSDRICRSYSDLNFGVTFLEHSVYCTISSVSWANIVICSAISIMQIFPNCHLPTAGHSGVQQISIGVDHVTVDTL